MDNLPELEDAENLENELPSDDGEMDDEPSQADDPSLAGGAGLSLVLSLLALALIGANHMTSHSWRTQSEPTLAVTVTAMVVMGLSMLIAVPSLIAAVAFALGALVTAQRHWGLAVLALLVSAAAAALFLLTG
jgi:LDH2 family malate/lactate/ureidoglycolate dehydrogenase